MRGVEIDREIFRRCSFRRSGARALERFLRAPQTIAMARVDRDRALRAQIFLRDALDNFLFQFGEAFVGHARNPQCVAAFPIAMLRQVALVQNKQLGLFTNPVRKVGRSWRVAIDDVQKQIA